MSQENVEIVRAMLVATGPETDRDEWLEEFFDPEIEWQDTPTYPSAGVHYGHDALRRHAAEYEDAWDDWGIEIEDIRAADDRVVARIRYRGVGKQSGAPITREQPRGTSDGLARRESEGMGSPDQGPVAGTGGLRTPATGAVFELRAGRIRRVQQFDTHAEALEAVGLSEQDAHADS